MNIGIVLYPTFGGSGVVATELGKALAKKGHQVHFITYAQPARLDGFEKNVFYHEVVVSDYPLFDYPPYETVLTSKIVDVAEHEKLDILHVHYAIPHASAAYMAKQILKKKGISLPFITTLHGTDITLVGKDPSFELVISFCINQSDIVTSVSKYLKETTYEHFKAEKEIIVVPNFIQPRKELAPPNLNLRRRYAKDDQYVLCHISNFRKVKRVEDVMKTFHLISQKKDGVLLLIGDGPERYKMEELCRSLRLCDKVLFLGKIRNTQPVLEISDLFLLTSEIESFGLAALEAMAAGVPVVSTNTGGLPEVNHHGVSGFLSHVGDIEDMASNSLKILESKDKHLSFRKGALKTAEKFEATKIISIYENLYHSLK